jgi:hypothetical protein
MTMVFPMIEMWGNVCSVLFRSSPEFHASVLFSTDQGILDGHVPAPQQGGEFFVGSAVTAVQITVTEVVPSSA